MTALGNRPTRRALGMLLAVFLGGVVVGGLAVLLYNGHNVFGARPHPPLRDELTQELQLSPAQRQQLDAILTEARRRWRTLDEQIQRQQQQLRMETRSQIRAILNPEQQKKFDAFLQRLDQERRSRQRR